MNKLAFETFFFSLSPPKLPLCGDVKNLERKIKNFEEKMFEILFGNIQTNVQLDNNEMKCSLFSNINVTIGRVLFSDPIAFVDAVIRQTYF